MESISKVTDQRIRDRRSTATVSPRNPSFVHEVLEPLARRSEAGEPARALSVELYTTLHPWALAFATSQSAGLPAHADRHEMVSQALRLTWDACARIDWTRYQAWPALLESKVSRTRAEAARTDDWLSRRERTRRRHFQSEMARLEQSEGRILTVDERAGVADAVAPRSNRVDWASAMLASRHPSSVPDVPDVIEDGTVEDQVEGREVSRIRTKCLLDWLAVVAAGNEGLAADLRRWSELDPSQERGLPARLAQRIEPYTPLLLAMLGEAA